MMSIYNKYVLASCLSLVAVISLAGCGNGNGPDQNKSPVKTTSAIAIPDKIKAAALPSGGTLSASIFMDGSATAAATQNVDVTAADVSFSLDVAAGDHTFTIVFTYDDATFSGGPFELARATSSTVSVTAGASQDVTFPAYTYKDSDSDGRYDIYELDDAVRTDPTDPTCIVDKSVIGDTSANGCTLG